MPNNLRLSALILAILVLFFASPKAYCAFDATDPSSRSPNARVIGLGRAYVGFSDDPAAIYFNPAGLARKTNWDFSSMSGKFLEDYNFLSFTGYYPTNFGVVGIGYGGYNISGAYPTTTQEGSNPADPIYIIDTSQPTMSNYNNVLTLSYSTGLDRFLSKYISWMDKIDVGANLKIFSAGLSGDHITNGSASGNEVDAGVMFKPAAFAKVGAVLQNLLPASMGGKLTYLSGHSEAYPALLKIGGMVKILGEEDAIRSFAKQDVALALDLDSKFQSSSDPMLYHLGLEWKPYPLVSLRAGIDQVLSDDGTGKNIAVSNPTYGVGLNYSGFRFDYAYHQLSGLPIDSAYFSLSYSPPAPKKIAVKVAVTDPKDRSFTFNDTLRIKGQVFDPAIRMLEVSGSKVIFSKAGSFDAEVVVQPGKNKYEVKSYNEKGKTQKPVDEQKIRVLKLAAFPDVPEGYWARTPISLISMINIVTGYPNGTFKPEGNITRAEMAALLMRAKSEILNPKSETNSKFELRKFKDVQSNHWAAKFIADAAAQKIVEGYPDKTFRPNGDINRAEGLAMIARFAGITKEAYEYQYYPDIASNFWASSIIAGASKADLLQFLKGKPFEPKRSMTRAEAVEVLSQTKFVKTVLDKDLLKWESY